MSLLDRGNPYLPALPDVVRLGWDDFEVRLSEANQAAIGEVADWAILNYMAADCDLAPYIFNNLLEMKAAGSSGRIHVCVLFDGPLLTDAFFARLNAGSRLSDDVIFRFFELDTSKPDTLTLAIRIATAYPARHRALFLSGHGAGWRGALVDQNTGSAQLDKAILPGPRAECQARLTAGLQRSQDIINEKIEAAAAAQSKTFDIVAFDACYTGMIESIGQFRDHTDILAVSEDQVPGAGYPYTDVMAHLAARPEQSPREFADYLVKATKRHGGTSITQVAIDSARLQDFADAFVRFVQETGPEMGRPDVFDAVKRAIQTSYFFEDTQGIDLKDFLDRLTDRPLPEAIRRSVDIVRAKWDEMVISQAVNAAAGVHGLAIYAPAPDRFDTDYIAAGNDLPLNLGIWTWFLASYYLRLLGDGAMKNNLLQAMQHTMEDLRAKGVYPG